MPKKKWSELSTGAKVAIAGGAAIDAGLRAWAIADLAGRDRSAVRGPKALWGLGLGAVNSAGLLPAAYLLAARKPAGES